jgi:urease accessory protein
MRRLQASLTAAAMFAATPALAHVGLHDQGGFMHGLAHPVGGMDHVLAMVGAGLLAAQIGGRASWLVPLSFVGMMVAGGLLGFAGIGLPMVEIVIAASVLVIGALVALEVKLPIAVAMALVGGFAVFHGYAHGLELPDGSAPLSYAAGFVIATAFLHAVGVGAGCLLARAAAAPRSWLTRAAGGLMAVAGVGLLAGS